MLFLEKSLQKFNLENLHDLIRNKVEEGQTLDYKRELPKDSLLKIIGALANTTGGCIFIGIKEKGGFPIEMSGIEVLNQEEFKQKIDRKIKNHIDPFIDGIKYSFISLKETNLYVVCIDIPKSLDLHAYTFNENVVFYKRVGAQNMQFSQAELKYRFRQENPKKQFEAHIESRISIIRQGNCHKTHPKFQQDPFFLFHVKPIYQSNIIYSEEMQKELCNYINKSRYISSIEIKPSFEGPFTRFGLNHQHVWLDTKGYIEYGGVAGGSFEASYYQIYQLPIEREFKEFFSKVILIIHKYQILTPLLISYTLSNVKGSRLGRNLEALASPLWNPSEILKRETYFTVSDPLNFISQESISKLSKNLFDPIWNDAGEKKSPFS